MPRLAVIGLGYWGPNLVRNFYAALGEDLVMVCDASPERLDAIARQYPTVRSTTCVDEVFAASEVDAVAIATPVATHYPLAKAALEAGKSVFVEKPMASSVAEARELVQLAQQCELVLMVDHVFVHNNAVKKIQELVGDGSIGKLLYIDSVRINLGRIQNDVNVVWDLAPHDISIVDAIVGRPPLSVAAHGATHTEHGLEDVAYIHLDYGNGLIANFHVNWLSPVKIRYTIVGGSEKSIVFNDLYAAETVKVFDSGVVVRQDDLEDRRRLLVDYRTGDTWSPHIPRAEPLANAVQDFLDCIDEGRTPLTDGLSGLRIVRILEAIQQSIRNNGQRITIAEQPPGATEAVCIPLEGAQTCPASSPVVP